MLKRYIITANCLFTFALIGTDVAYSEEPVRKELANQAFRLVVKIDTGTVVAGVEDKAMGVLVAEGPILYHAVKKNAGEPVKAQRLESPALSLDGKRLIIRGKLAGTTIEHSFTLPDGQHVMDEQIVVKNATENMIVLTEFEVGMTRLVTDRNNDVLPKLTEDRVVAVPFRYRMLDLYIPLSHLYDYSIDDLVNKPGQVRRMASSGRVERFASRHRWSEGWAWTHGQHTLGIFSFNQENMVYSIISQVALNKGTALRIGGAVMIAGEPSALTRIAPGSQVNMGLIRYQAIPGDFTDAIYAYRKMLDEKGCRFPKNYNPPVHWEQLYDMDGAWNNRAEEYARSIIEIQAAQGRDYSCEALYLDPGWDTDFGTFLWGEQWLGPRKQFIDEMQTYYGLKVSLHCPLATWMSSRASWGIGAVDTYPQASLRKLPAGAVDAGELIVPVTNVRDGCRNLALLPSAKAKASSIHLSGTNPFYQVTNLNDGWVGNTVSWVADELPAWIEIDLGANYEISAVVLGNDHCQRFKNRSVSELNILAATEYNAVSQSENWQKVAEYHGAGIQVEEILSFTPILARWVRVVMTQTTDSLPPRIDEIEIYEADPVSGTDAEAFEKSVLVEKGTPVRNPMVCLGSKQYLETAEKRLLANCADGVSFLMFDGNWWNGGCSDSNHGHPVPYLMEDHIRASLDLAQRIHASYPEVLIEMHDMIAGGFNRLTPIYYKYGLPGSYNENWGFELMWDILEDVTSGRALMLYYATLGCNVPIYLHINLAQDNENLLGFWWYASTCRHLGIGGTHKNPKIADDQKIAMKYYRRFDRFFKRGEFYGISEEIHLHALPEENTFVVNIFNLSDKPRIVSGSFDLKKAKMRAGDYRSSQPWAKVSGEILHVNLQMPAWSAQVTDVHAGR